MGSLREQTGGAGQRRAAARRKRKWERGALGDAPPSGFSAFLLHGASPERCRGWGRRGFETHPRGRGCGEPAGQPQPCGGLEGSVRGQLGGLDLPFYSSSYFESLYFFFFERCDLYIFFYFLRIRPFDFFIIIIFIFLFFFLIFLGSTPCRPLLPNPKRSRLTPRPSQSSAAGQEPLSTAWAGRWAPGTEAWRRDGSFPRAWREQSGCGGPGAGRREERPRRFRAGGA